MRNFIKKIYKSFPLFIKIVLLKSREHYFYLICLYKEKKEYRNLPVSNRINRDVKNILIYHISGLNYAGTEKTLQLIANNLIKDFNVYYMYSRKGFSERQKELMDSRINLIEFKYKYVEDVFPYFIHGISPHLKNVISDNNIDLFITADSGHSQYPFNTIRDIPIILINIFGSPTLQKNIISDIFISKQIMDYSEIYTGKQKKNIWAHLAVIPPKNIDDLNTSLIRTRLDIPLSAFVFGRIGRASDSIFDPIGINAFKDLVKKYPDIYYLIMSPPPILKKIVNDENIPNVVFMDDKEDIWEFYTAIDTLAHFRFDGESFGLSIAEAMHVGKPIISHKSHIWNAHLEYLKPSFSRVAKRNDINQYESFMEEFLLIKEKNPNKWQKMKDEAKRTAEENFSEEKYMENIRLAIKSIPHEKTF